MINWLNKIFHWIYKKKKKNSKNVPVLSLWNPPNPLKETNTDRADTGDTIIGAPIVGQ